MKNRHAIQAYKLQAFQKKGDSPKEGNKKDSKAELLSAKQQGETQQNKQQNKQQGEVYRTGPFSQGNAAGMIGRNGFLKTGFGHKKAAKLLLLLGKEQAAIVLKHLSQDEIEKVTGEIAKIKRIEKAEAEKILEEFGDISGKITANPRGGVETAREMLTSSMGKEKADEILGKIHPYSGDRPFA